jgi:hypothetical protein
MIDSIRFDNNNHQNISLAINMKFTKSRAILLILPH